MSKKSKNISILQPGYLPWLGYFDLVARSDVFIIYDDVAFDKSWRNRNRILASNGPLWLSVPIHQSSMKCNTLNDIRIDGDHWLRKHLKTIKQFYGKAPYFDWLFPELENYLTLRSYGWLLDLCLEGHNCLTALLGLSPMIKLSSDLNIGFPGKTERLIAICQALDGSKYISANASKSYMDEDLWDRAGIELTYQNYNPPRYAQGDRDNFVSHLSIVDALMWVGPIATNLLGKRTSTVFVEDGT